MIVISTYGIISDTNRYQLLCMIIGISSVSFKDNSSLLSFQYEWEANNFLLITVLFQTQTENPNVVGTINDIVSLLGNGDDDAIWHI